MNEWKIRCTGKLHTIRYNGKRWLFPDHDHKSDVMVLLGGQKPQCLALKELIERNITRHFTVCKSDVRALKIGNTSLVNKVGAWSLEIANKRNKRAELKSCAQAQEARDRLKHQKDFFSRIEAAVGGRFARVMLRVAPALGFTAPRVCSMHWVEPYHNYPYPAAIRFKKEKAELYAIPTIRDIHVGVGGLTIVVRGPKGLQYLTPKVLVTWANEHQSSLIFEYVDILDLPIEETVISPKLPRQVIEYSKEPQWGTYMY